MKFEPKKELVGERLVLRKPELTFEFAEKMFNAIDENRDHILPWLDWAMTTVTKIPEDDYNFAKEADEDWDLGKRFEYSILDKRTGEFLGGLGVMQRGRSNDKYFEIGYWLAKSACGKGYMQEAVKLIEKEFFVLGVERLMIKNDVENINSKRVAERLGYVFEGVERHARYSEYLKKFVDTNVFSKLKGEYTGE